MTKAKTTLIVLGPLIVVGLAALAGTFKFNLTDNDILVASPSASTQDLVGAWVQPIPGQSGMQGFELHADGTANSINMETLRYMRWRFSHGHLYLTAESIGNHSSSIGEEEFVVDSADKHRLQLRQDDHVMLYRRDSRE